MSVNAKRTPSTTPSPFGRGATASDAILLVPPLRGYLLDTPAVLARFLGLHLMTQPTEQMLAVLLNQEYHLLEILILGQGDAHTVPVSLPALVLAVARTGASRIVLAHNHPQGPHPLQFSRADLQITRRARLLMAALGAQLLDHLVFDSAGRWISWRLPVVPRRPAPPPPAPPITPSAPSSRTRRSGSPRHRTAAHERP